jgi:hypothetical protein
MGTIDTIRDDMHIAMREHVESLPMCTADRLGLDTRCGSLYIDDHYVIVEKYRDRSLQYYGGFEYIDDESREEIGNYVVYSADDERVRECLYHYDRLSIEENQQ